jgi:Cu/Ag efflux protein CusF
MLGHQCEQEAKMQFAKLRFTLPFIACGLAAGDAAEVRETGATGIFYGRGVVKAVEPGTGWLTIGHNDIVGCMPAMEMMFRIRAPEVSRGLRPGDIVDFTLDGGKYVILETKLVSRAQ